MSRIAEAAASSTRRRRRAARWAAATGGLATLLPALAQTPPAAPAAASAPAPARADGVQQMEAVVITANKRAEKQREVAGTVSVLDGADLERRGARDQEDVLKLAPGVQFNKGDISSNTITIRGIGTSTTNEGSGAQQGPTGQYLEDVPLASAQGKGIVWDPITFDLDRIEVLRGPQGVLFGSGSLGGAVRYLFNKPNLSQFEASVKGEYANASGGNGKFSEYAMLNAPLASGSAGIRVVVFDRRDPGYIDNLGTGNKDANEVHQTGGRVLVTVKPVNEVVATLVASTQETKQGDTFSVSPDKNKLEHTAPNDSTRKVQNDFYSLTVDWNFGPATLTSITGYWKNKTKDLIDDTELFASVGLVLPEVYRPQSSSDHATSQEIRIASNGGGPFSYVAGVFYQKSKSSFAGKQIDPSAAFGITDLVDLTSEGGGSEKAIFADTEYAFGNGWSAGVGARYYRTRTSGSQDGTVFGAPSAYTLPDGEDHGVTPKVTVKYRFGENLWYALASKGYRYGGVNGPTTFTPFKSDSLWNYETGVRLVPARGLQVDLTAFYLDWKDAQFTFFEMVNGLPSSSIGNVGKARSTGIEAALRYRVNEAFDFGAAFAYVNAKTTAEVQIPSGGPTSVTAPSGSRLPGTPKLQTALDGSYRFQGPWESSGRASATWTHVGDRVMFLGGNKPADAYDTVDAGVSFMRQNWTVAFGVANLGNEKGVLSITGAPAGVGSFAQYFLQRPRTYTMSLRYDY
ncbi:MAG: TonB-dependent receptor [Burkholderiales bacterium]|nr:TonB-dependent receptor [Burkholderiales bacterium]